MTAWQVGTGGQVCDPSQAARSQAAPQRLPGPAAARGWPLLYALGFQYLQYHSDEAPADATCKNHVGPSRWVQVANACFTF